MKRMRIVTMALAISLLYACDKEGITPQKKSQDPINKETPKPDPKKPEDPKDPKPQNPETPPKKDGQGDQGNGEQGNGEQGKGNQGNDEKKPQVRPDDATLAKRSRALWKKSVELTSREFDLEGLLKNDTQRYTVDYLSKFVNFVSSDVSGVAYQLTVDDLKDLKVEEIKYNLQTNKLTLRTRYKGIPSQDLSELSLKKEEYFDAQIKIDETFARQYYALGIARNLRQYVGDAMVYDQARYAVVPTSDSGTLGDDATSLRFEVKVSFANNDETICTLDKTIKGFRPVSTLASDIHAHAPLELVEHIRTKVKNFDKSYELLNATIESWIRKVKFTTTTSDPIPLYWDNNVLRGDSRSTKLDVYLAQPKFKLLSAKMKDRDMHLEILLEGTSDYATINAKIALVVPQVK